MTKEEEKKPVVVFRMTDGSDLIGTLDRIVMANDTFVIGNPLSVISGYSQEHDSKYFYFEPALPLSDDTVIVVDQSKVVFRVPVRADIAKAYEDFLGHQDNDGKAKPLAEAMQETIEELSAQLLGKRTIH